MPGGDRRATEEADPGRSSAPLTEGPNASAAAVQGGEGSEADPFRGGRQYAIERSIYENPERRSRIVAFYTQIVGSRSIAETILREAYKHEVPFSLAVSLAYVESSFNPRAVNVNFSSVDRGLFQLNNRSFPELTTDEFFNPRVNTEIGIAYLKWCLEHGESEVAALAMYNAGVRRVNERGAPKMTLDHISRILAYRSRIEERFDASFDVPHRSAAAAGRPAASRLASNEPRERSR